MKDHPPAPPGSPQELFLANLDLIEKLAELVSRRHHASVEEAEEFASELKFKLMADDYAVFRKFKGTSSLKTYLATVAVNVFRDFRNRRWGKWRASAAARALGPVAIRMEELVDKEGRSFEDACEILLTNHKVAASRRELLEIWKRLPPRTSRRMEGEEELQDLPAPGARPEERVLERELRETRARISLALKKALDSLSSDERLLIRMSIVDSLKIVDVAKSLCMEQKPLYRLREKILRKLRTGLEREGVRWEQIADLLNRADFSWGFSGRKPRKTEEN
jgi:RNA polymerase sigma factor (sigma-70 family)